MEGGEDSRKRKKLDDWVWGFFCFKKICETSRAEKRKFCPPMSECRVGMEGDWRFLNLSNSTQSNAEMGGGGSRGGGLYTRIVGAVLLLLRRCCLANDLRGPPPKKSHFFRKNGGEIRMFAALARRAISEEITSLYVRFCCCIYMWVGFLTMERVQLLHFPTMLRIKRGRNSHFPPFFS